MAITVISGQGSINTSIGSNVLLTPVAGEEWIINFFCIYNSGSAQVFFGSASTGSLSFSGLKLTGSSDPIQARFVLNNSTPLYYSAGAAGVELYYSYSGYKKT
jgi:hypothetical protein